MTLRSQIPRPRPTATASHRQHMNLLWHRSKKIGPHHLCAKRQFAAVADLRAGGQRIQNSPTHSQELGFISRFWQLPTVASFCTPQYKTALTLDKQKKWNLCRVPPLEPEKCLSILRYVITNPASASSQLLVLWPVPRHCWTLGWLHTGGSRCLLEAQVSEP